MESLNNFLHISGKWMGIDIHTENGCCLICSIDYPYTVSDVVTSLIHIVCWHIFSVRNIHGLCTVTIHNSVYDLKFWFILEGIPSVCVYSCEINSPTIPLCNKLYILEDCLWVEFCCLSGSTLYRGQNNGNLFSAHSFTITQMVSKKNNLTSYLTGRHITWATD